MCVWFWRDPTYTCVGNHDFVYAFWNSFWGTLRIHTATHCNTLQHTATHCNTRQHTTTHCNTLQYIAIHCSTLQHTATHCNTLQYTATETSIQRRAPSKRGIRVDASTAWHASSITTVSKPTVIRAKKSCPLESVYSVMRCSVMRYDAVGCSALQCCLVWNPTVICTNNSVCSKSFAVWCSVLQRVAACCSVLQRVAVLFY